MASTPSIPAANALAALEGAACLLDGRGAIVAHNDAWTRLGALSDGLGSPIGLIVPADATGTRLAHRLLADNGPLRAEATQLGHAIAEVLAGRAPSVRIPYTLRTPQGIRPATVEVRPLAGLYLVHHRDERPAEDRTALLAARMEAEDLRARLARQRRLLEAMAKEMNTPITPVRLQLHMLGAGIAGPLTPRQHAALDVLQRNTDRWARVTQAFMMMLTDERHEPRHERLDLAAIAAGQAKAASTPAIQQGIRLVSMLPGPVPGNGDEEDVAEILRTFIAHALAQSPAGSTVAIEARMHGVEAVVEVRDSGPGVAPRVAAAMFEPWGPGGQNVPLSLYRCRILAERLGGRVWAESEGARQGLILGLGIPSVPAATGEAAAAQPA